LTHLVYNLLFIIFLCTLWLLALKGRSISINFFKNKVLLNLVFYFIFVKLILHFSIPSILRIISDYKFEKEDNVRIFDLLTIYIIEIFSWIFWLVGFIIVGVFFREKYDKIEKDDFIKKSSSKSNFLILIISFGFIIHMYFMVSLNTEGLIFSLFSQLFFFAGLTIGPLLIISYKKSFNIFYLVLGIFVFIISLFSLATRGAMIYSFFYILFLIGYLFYSRRILIRLTIVSILTVVIFSIFPDLLGGRISVNENGINLVAQDFSEKQQGRSFIDEIEWRLGAPTRIGTAFIQLREESPAGFNPIKNSLIGILPRSINENKPHPSALVGNNPYSLGMYLICHKIYGTESLMVEFPTGAHFYWEFGILGIVFLSLISGIYIAICLKLWSRIGLISIPLLIATFKPFGYVDPKIWVSDIAMQLYQIIIPTIFLISIFKSYTFIAKIIKKNYS
jgi:hypothetical protein